MIKKNSKIKKNVMKQGSIFEALKENFRTAFQKCREHKILWLAVMILDVLFFLALMRITEYYLLMIKEDVLKLMDVVQQATGTLSLEEADMSSLLLVKQTAESYYNAILVNAGWMILYLAIAYIILHGIAWYVSSLISGEKFGRIPSFFGKFSTLAIMQTVIALILLYFSGISENAGANAVTVISSDTTLLLKQILFGIVFFVFGYFFLLSYGFIPSKNWLKNIFVQGYKQAKYLIPEYAAALLLFSLSFAAMYYISLYSPVTALAFAIIVVLPLFAYLRVFVFGMARKI